ncbi:MAG TPA: amidohydrolase family protein, partial [Gemmatimonadales bacterium]|nr:amidohydrolase family protein [Gemmatimonadales bacterium]
MKWFTIWATCLLAVPALAAQDRYDLVISGGTVVDGTGTPGFRADVGVRGGRIVRISPRRIPAGSAQRVIDANGLIVTPGFIDLHAHIEGLPRMPDAQSHVRQGVTLAIGGPDGGGPWPFGEYLA